MEQKKTIIIVVVVAAVFLAAASVAMSMRGSGESHRNLSEVPPKGAGKFDH